MISRFLASTALLSASLLCAQEIRKVPPSPTSPASGKEMFSAYCAPCHGADATGNGPAAPALKMTPANLTQLAVRNKNKYPEAKVFNAIKGDSNTPAHGSKDMPVWGSVLSELAHGNQAEVQMRITNLVNYIKGLQR